MVEIREVHLDHGALKFYLDKRVGRRGQGTIELRKWGLFALLADDELDKFAQEANLPPSELAAVRESQRRILSHASDEDLRTVAVSILREELDRVEKQVTGMQMVAKIMEPKNPPQSEPEHPD